MKNVFSFGLRNSTDVKWAWLITIFIFAVPLILFLLKFRLQKVEKVGIVKRIVIPIILFAGWMLCVGVTYSPNFGYFLMHWFYLPLVFIANVMINIAWGVTPVLILSALVIPALYSYIVSSALLRYKIVRKKNTA
ncbi:MAG: hypothetical protein GY750_07605 [Lentisphaerae bacterium]|nr:hypothetical protein [Lentisphaerota bacterium]MCP4101273.1 hypothetical protein [Lentisphaerota bacterium]